jgi:hypothetical protein
MRHLHHGTYGGVEAQNHTLTLATDGSQPLRLHPGHFMPKEAQYTLNKAQGLQNWSDLEKRNITSLLETELNSSVSQPPT